MKYVYLLIFIGTFFSFSQNIAAQKLSFPITKPANGVIKCYTVEIVNEFRRTHPNAETDAQFESWLNKKIQLRKTERPLAANYIIPIIFHIISDGDPVGTAPNLSAAQINQQILQLNKDFANKSNSPYSVAADAQIQFVLAKNDTLGNPLPEPGIDRINRSAKNWLDYSADGWRATYVSDTIKPKSIWQPGRYYNVWLVPRIFNEKNTILGFATFPVSSNLQGLFSGETDSTAGVVIQTGTIGSAFAPYNCGASSYGLGKTLTHESGHFFGLRHIWGDTNCGNDYCDDTPVHFINNEGIQTHPKSNSCGTPDEMFENYMDYTDDIQLNTFTKNQVDRMQTVMVNSPRRGSLATSTVGNIPVTASNKISFNNCSGTLSIFERGSNNGYPRYNDLPLTINIEDRATGNATVAIALTGTAVIGKDYQLLTPATLNYVAGDNDKAINIRIFDNVKVDGDKTIIINYTITGTGVTAGTSAQTLTITIADDDNIKVGENSINLLKENFENPTGTPGLPAGWGRLSTSGYINTFVASNNGDAGGSGNAAHITNDKTLKPNIYTKGIDGAAILQSTVIDGSSVLSVDNLSFKYKVGGLSGSDFAFVVYNYANKPLGPFTPFGNTPGLTGYGPYVASGTAPIANSPSLTANDNLSNTKFNIDFYWRTGTATNGINPGFNVDDVVLTATPFHIETAVSSSYKYDVESGTGVNNFKSTNNKALVTISNAGENLSSVKAEITRSGAGTTPIVTTGGSFASSNKVIKISPAVSNTTATYQATFYFTEAELAAWGTSKLSLKILKIKDGVDLNSTLNAGNSEVITPTIFEDAVAGYVTYTGNFTGFSQYMLVSPATTYMITLTNFTATANKKNVLLNWSTLSELNVSGFMIERSTDSIIFKQIGFVNSKGNSSTTTSYVFTDNFAQPNVKFYYRLRQVNKDNGQVFSTIKNATIIQSAKNIVISLSPNPAQDYINLFVSGTSNLANVEVINSTGQKIILKTLVNAFDGPYKISLGYIAKGIYTVVVQLAEGTYTKQFVVNR